MNRIEKKVIAITCLGHALSHTYLLILAGALTTIARDLEFTLTRLTSIGTLSYFLFGLGAIPAGYFVAKTNAKFILKGFFLLSSLASFFIGFTQRPAFFTLGLGLLGAAAGLYHVSGITLITQTVRLKGKALGLHGMAGSAGIALSPLLAASILSFSNWHMIYLVMALPGLIGWMLLVSDKEIPDVHPDVRHADSMQPIKNRNWIFGLGILAMALNGFIYRGFMTILPTYVMQQFSGSNHGLINAGLLSTLILSIGMFGQYMGGQLSDRFNIIKLYLIAVLCTVPFLFMLGFSTGIPTILLGIGFSLFHFPQQPIENHLISKWMPPQWVSSGYGIKFAVAFGAGSFASGGTGIVADNTSISYVFPLLGLIAASVAFTIWVIYRITSHN